TLHKRERQDLHSALAAVGWSNRLLTTQALGELGESVPRISSTKVEREGEHGGRQWRIVLTGTSFHSGASVLLNGRPWGSVLSASPTTIVVLWSGDDSSINGALGIQNPDGTAAQTTTMQFESGSPSPVPTSTGDDHGGHDGGGGDDHGGGGSGGSSGG